MTVGIEDIKKLRESTGVSMMACKSALEEAGGDFDKAVDILRKKGEAASAKRADRATANGIVVVNTAGNKTAMVELQCETDFVANGDDFIALANKIADKLLSGEIKPDERDLPEIKEAMLKMGENIKIANMKLIEGENVGNYVHSNKRIGVVVSLQGGNQELAKDIAMHVAATNPSVVSPEEISDDLVAKEKEIWAEQLKNEGKPEEIIDKIMMGKEKKFREENALLKQAFVKNPEKDIEAMLKEADAAIKEFERFAI